ncbi:UNVERIFIED_CONTAM: hypothetical protein Sradi_3280000 [Sesamum radiatum]|uniref:Reverse transcriptase domain-containing protein n=1 Tax=Sesamum radiatum TaxID=300843 RepID=A0AAW2R1H9_SESRA
MELSTIYSDHAVLILDTKPDRHSGYKTVKPFRFEASWMRTAECEQAISEAWQQSNGSTAQDQLLRNFERCQLKLLSRMKMGHKVLKNEISDIQTKIQRLRKQSITTETKQQENGLRKELERLLQPEEILWKQRSKSHWLREGDRNTKFFHAHANKTFRRNQIRRLKNSAGAWIEEEKDIEHHITQYFGRIFSSAEPSINELERGVEALTRKVDSNMNADLLKPYTIDEITAALSSMAPLKSPGPDGMPPVFFQNHWHIIKTDVINCVFNILHDRVLDPKLNYTHIVLIPKNHKPELITHFRPISLCNVIMKITTKCIANRLKPLLDKIIAPTQSVFVPGRLITDNVLIVFEINHFLKNKNWGKAGHMALKMDISKVYDKIEWSFLRQAGKEILIKVVLQAIPTYAMGVFRLPEGLLREIERMIASFWWNSTENRKIHWLSWETLCSSKLIGGLGLRDLRAFNSAMLAKQFWRLLTNPTSLTARLLQARYYPGLSILDADLGSRPSLTWRSILSTKGIIQAGYRWRIGDGKQARIWIDPWITNHHHFGQELA